jgi:hypothetical protein
MADLTDTAFGLLGLAIVAGVAEKIIDDDKPRKKKRKEEKPFKW